MRLSALLFLLLLAASLGTTRVDTATTAAEKVYEGAEEESDPCSSDAPGTVLCGRIRVPVG